MPDAAEVDAIVFEFHHRGDHGKALDAADKRILHRLANALGKGQILSTFECLITEKDHHMLVPQAADFGDGVVRQLAPQVHAADFGADGPGDFGDSYFRHDASPLCVPLCVPLSVRSPARSIPEARL